MILYKTDHLEVLESGEIKSNHPLVQKAWISGGGSISPTDGEIYDFINVSLRNGTHISFKVEDGWENAFKQVEKTISSLC